MKNKMSAKIKWAIGLLIVRIVGAISTGMDTAKTLGVSFDYSRYFVFSALYEQLPTIAAVILIFYNHKQPKTENAGFTLMQKWIFALVWVQHAYAFISFALANSLTSVWAKILGGCVWLGVITYLLYSAWKNPITVKKEDTQEIPKTVPPLPYTKPENTAKKNTENFDRESNLGILLLCLVLIAIIGIIILGSINP